MISDPGNLLIAEIPYEGGQIHFRFAYVPSEDGSKAVRHGLFVQYREDGTIACEGNFERDLEHGIWRDYHENGMLAAQGYYSYGKHEGPWQFWSSDGKDEGITVYKDGVEVISA